MYVSFKRYFKVAAISDVLSTTFLSSNFIYKKHKHNRVT